VPRHPRIQHDVARVLKRVFPISHTTQSDVQAVRQQAAKGQPLVEPSALPGYNEDQSGIWGGFD